MASLVDELFGAVPRLVDRTRDQLDLATRLLLRLPCLANIVGGHSPEPDGDEADEPVAAAASAEEAAVTDVVTLQPDPAKRAARPPSARASTTSPLAIPGYDELAASQVMPRLDALDSSRKADLTTRASILYYHLNSNVRFQTIFS